MKKFLNLPAQSIEQNSNKYTIRPATEDDVLETMNLIHSAYKYWVDNGVNVSPASQIESQTRDHLLHGGYIVEDEKRNIVGTFSLEDVLFEETQEFITANYSGSNKTIQYEKNSAKVLLGKNYLVLKKLAISPSISKKGLGGIIYSLVEKFSKDQEYTGISLETVVEAQWLYNWYVKLGFKEIGSCKYQGSSFDTLLLLKNFR